MPIDLIWGEDDYKTILVRYYVTMVLPDSITGRFLHRLYVRYEARWAEMIQQSVRWRRFFERVFNWVLSMARRNVCSATKKRIEALVEVKKVTSGRI